MRERAGRFKYLDGLTTAFVVVLLVSNLVAQKVCLIGPFAVSGAVLLFPITYIFGDVFTEVYGFGASRRAIWLGFFGTGLLYLIGAVVIALPAAPGWGNQAAFATVFGFIPRILAASLVAFWTGEFANSYTMARLKLLTRGAVAVDADGGVDGGGAGGGYGAGDYADVRGDLPVADAGEHHCGGVRAEGGV